MTTEQKDTLYEDALLDLKNRGLIIEGYIEQVRNYGMYDEMWYRCINTACGMEHSKSERFECIYYKQRERVIKRLMKLEGLNYTTHPAGLSRGRIY